MDENSLFNKTLKQLEILFSFAGIPIRSGAYKTVDRFKSRCLYLLHSFAANYQLFSCICWCIKGIKNEEDFLGITYNAPCITINFLAQFKGLLLIKNEKSARKLISNLKNLDEKEKQTLQSGEKEDIVDTEVKFLKFVMKTLNIFYVAIVAGFSISPLVLIVVNYIQTKELMLTLPFFAEYGFDPFQKMIWPFIYIHQCWAGMISMTVELEFPVPQF